MRDGERDGERETDRETENLPVFTMQILLQGFSHAFLEGEKHTTTGPPAGSNAFSMCYSQR